MTGSLNQTCSCGVLTPQRATLKGRNYIEDGALINIIKMQNDKPKFKKEFRGIRKHKFSGLSTFGQPAGIFRSPLASGEAKASPLHVSFPLSLDGRKGGQASSENLLPLGYGEREKVMVRVKYPSCLHRFVP